MVRKPQVPTEVDYTMAYGGSQGHYSQDHPLQNHWHSHSLIHAIQ